MAGFLIGMSSDSFWSVEDSPQFKSKVSAPLQPPVPGTSQPKL